jgi:hypothetical protein
VSVEDIHLKPQMRSYEIRTLADIYMFESPLEIHNSIKNFFFTNLFGSG